MSVYSIYFPIKYVDFFHSFPYKKGTPIGSKYYYSIHAKGSAVGVKKEVSIPCDFTYNKEALEGGL